ncbi:MAG: DUF948 domain-containing protein [Gemmatimonadota bacterium]|nr:DUF948 domain-containing protein [Gemmatimonadota bacterium]
MMHVSGLALALLPQAQQAARAIADTQLVRAVVEPHGWVQTVTGIAMALLSIVFLALCFVLLPAAWNLRKTYGKINALLKRLDADITPIVKHASTIADNVDYVTTSIRVDVQQVSATIATANDRLNAALAAAEQRVQDLNALLRVVQDEVESTFVGTASAVRGVRAGVASFRDGAVGESEPSDVEFDDDHDDDHDADHDADQIDLLNEAEEAEDGYDDRIAADELEPRAGGPRIRPRPKHRAAD